MTSPLLSVENLGVEFRQGGHVTVAVEGVSFDIDKGETVALVGESGSGKSVTALSVMKLLPYPAASHPTGKILFKGNDLLSASGKDLRRVRGNDIGIVFQEPMTSLNPLHTIERQVGEVLKVHQGLSESAARATVLELLQKVGIREAESRLGAYPHQLSGGQRQRVMIAMALSCNPRLLIADEPTTALDVTIQAQILDLMRTLQRETGTAIILITHDLGVVAEMCDRAAVMYAGEIVEQTDVRTLFSDPRHPYTQGLIGAVPVPGEIREELATIPGSVPNLIELPDGCRFAPRCLAREAHGNMLAERAHPELRSVAEDHLVRCWLYHHEDGGLRRDPDHWPEAAALPTTPGVRP